MSLLLVVLSAIGAIFAQPGAQKDQTLSRNKKFSAEMSAARLDKPLLSVLDRTGDTPVLLWARSIVPEGEDAQEFSAPWDLNSFRKIVSDDGTFVLLRQRYFRLDLPVLRVFTKNVDKSFDADALVEVLGVRRIHVERRTNFANQNTFLQPSLG